MASGSSRGKGIGAWRAKKTAAAQRGQKYTPWNKNMSTPF